MIAQKDVKKRLENFLGEHLDGYVVLGFVAGSNEFVMLSEVTDQKTGIALNNQIGAVIMSGGVGVKQAEDESSEA